MALFRCRYFHDPQPNHRVVLDAVSSFVGEIHRSLRLGVNRACSFTVDFRTNVFRRLFGSKGRDCPHRLGRYYEKEDFDEAFFPLDRFKCCDRLGDFCTIRFPICMYSKVQWLPVVYTKDEDGVVVPQKRSYKETCHVYVCKVRL